MDFERNQPPKASETEDPASINLLKTNKVFDSTISKAEKGKELPTWSENLSYYFSQYCGATSIHGIQYIGERGRFILEKVVWVGIVTVVCYFCIFLISKTYHKWQTQPVIVTFATKETSIWKIPFPAVTICPEVKSNPEVFNYTNALQKKVFGMQTSPEEERYFQAFSIICSDAGISEELNIERNLTVNDKIWDDLIEAHPPIDPYKLSTIRWLGKKYNLTDILSVSVTKEGFCYSFNMFHYDEILKHPMDDLTDRSLNNTRIKKWTLENGYANDDEEDSFPRRTFLSGMSGGFSFEGLFANDSHLDHICTDFLQGFKVTLHHPSELPNMDKHFRVPLDQAVLVAIKPRMTTASEELKSYKPEDRECYFSDERSLKYFKSYTQQNCLDECLSNYTWAKCKCVPFYLLHDDVPICGPGNNDCVEMSKVEYISKKTNCNCMPFCTSLHYDVEITQTDWNWNELFKTISRIGGATFIDSLIDYKKSHLSKLVVFYKDQQFLASERHELYGYVDFFSNVGGLLGLFIGFSVTSFIEILYFLTLRLGCNIKKFGRSFWSGEPSFVNSEN